MTFFRSVLANNEASKYAAAADFAWVFEHHMDALYQLASLLTADPEQAEKLLVGSLEDAVQTNQVFKEWTYTWLKRTVIKHAINAVNPRPTQSTHPPKPRGHSSGRHEAQAYSPALNRILALTDFDRFVFVITTLEGFSEHDGALLLSATQREVREARIRALKIVGGMETEPVCPAAVPIPHETRGSPAVCFRMAPIEPSLFRGGRNYQD